MAVVEALLLTCMAAAMALSSYTDYKNNLIPNKQLLQCAVPAFVFDAVYYGVFASEYLALFLINLAVLFVVGIVFYAYSLWAAGDCKLLITLGVCIPGRFYSFWGSGLGASFYIVAFTFSLAFLYIVAESIIMGIRDKQLFSVTFEGFDLKDAAISYFSMVGALTLIGFLLAMLVPALYEGSTVLPVAVNFLLVLTLIRLRERFGLKTLLIAAIAMWALLIALAAAGLVNLSFGGNILSWLVVLLVMALRVISDKYNYKAIPTAEVRKGYILSAASIVAFQGSRVRGLPTGSTEDLRSRLTEEQAASVRRWASSSTGKPYIIIVRKIPFAIFISVGTIVFLAFEVAMSWHF